MLLKVRARSLEKMRDIVVNKLSRLPQIADARLMAVLKTVKEEHSISLKRDISDANTTAT